MSPARTVAMGVSLPLDAAATEGGQGEQGQGPQPMGPVARGGAAQAAAVVVVVIVIVVVCADRTATGASAGILVERGSTLSHSAIVARELGIPSAEKPASPCLASRIPHGTTVDAATLARIDAAETSLKGLGMVNLRVRHFGELARVELGDAELSLLDEPTATAAVAAVEMSDRPYVAEALVRPTRMG